MTCSRSCARAWRTSGRPVRISDRMGGQMGEPVANQALIAALRAALAARADPAKAEPMRAYMKSALPYLGVQSPRQAAAYRDVSPRYPLSSYPEWRATIETLWRQAHYREERYAAIALAGDRRYHVYQTPESLSLYEELIVTGAWWDLVDGVASHLVGELLRRYGDELRPTMLDWSRDPNLWKRRTAILCQVGAKTATVEALLYGCILPNLADHDFFIRKAIGWALREYAKTSPESVRAFVEQHEAQLSPLSRREALKHLSGAASVPGASTRRA